MPREERRVEQKEADAERHQHHGHVKCQRQAAHERWRAGPATGARGVPGRRARLVVHHQRRRHGGGFVRFLWESACTSFGRCPIGLSRSPFLLHTGCVSSARQQQRRADVPAEGAWRRASRAWHPQEFSIVFHTAFERPHQGQRRQPRCGPRDNELGGGRLLVTRLRHGVRHAALKGVLCPAPAAGGKAAYGSMRMRHPPAAAAAAPARRSVTALPQPTPGGSRKAAAAAGLPSWTLRTWAMHALEQRRRTF
eukprot:363801-Chlamydomonas_euryale.AAC.19